MWRKATSTLVRMDSKQEWDALDVVSKWLIATRSGVTTVTLYSCTIAGLLALRGGSFPWLTWLIVTVGLFLAHGANNLLNDYTDYSRGIDNDNYFRTQYGVHPLVQGFWDKKTQIRWFVVSGVLALLSALFAIFYSHFDPVVIGLCRLWLAHAAALHLPAEVLCPRRADDLPDLGAHHDRRRVLRPDAAVELGRGAGRHPLRPEHGEHQHRQAHRQVRRGQAEGRRHAARAASGRPRRAT